MVAPLTYTGATTKKQEPDMITFTAFITTENDEPDAGLLIQINDEEDGTSYYQGDAARIDIATQTEANRRGNTVSFTWGGKKYTGTVIDAFTAFDGKDYVRISAPDIRRAEIKLLAKNVRRIDIDIPGFALADSDGELDTEAAGKLLSLAGFVMAGAGWSRSAGQWIAKVEKA